jgi:uncharacterized membrane protein
MTDYLVEGFLNFPPALATFLIAMLPIGELRASVPIAVGVFNLSPSYALLWSILGNTVPIIFLLFFLEPFSRFLIRHSKILSKFFDWLFARTRKKHTKKFERWGALALISLVAIPLPFTGGWTGALAAFVFGVPFKKAFPLIFLGIIIAGVIVTVTVSGIFSVF